MALGIGATTILFSVTYGVLVKPLPWANADRVVVLKETRGGSAPRFGDFTNAAYLAWRGRTDRAALLGGIGVTLIVLGLLAPRLLKWPSAVWW